MFVRTCGNCFYSRSIGSETAVACRRYPPAITKVEDNTVTSHFPLLSIENWCGEWSKQVNGKAVPKKGSYVPR